MGNFLMKYLDEINRAMEYYASIPNVIFLGQSIKYPGNAIYKTLISADTSKKIEMPVTEEMQMGISTGLALQGFIPVTCYPRFDFLILATNQLVNHLDKIKHMTDSKLNPKVIIRVSVGSVRPLNPGIQHRQDYTKEFKSMLTNVNVITLNEPEEIYPAFEYAISDENKKSSLIIDYGDFYNEK